MFSLYPIFHWILATQRKMKLATQRNLYSTDLHWGLALGVMQILGLASGVMQIFALLDTNMLVSPTQNSGVGGLDQRKAPAREFCVVVEYRLKCQIFVHHVTVSRVGSLINSFNRQVSGFCRRTCTASMNTQILQC